MSDLTYELQRRDREAVQSREADQRRFTPLRDYSTRRGACPICGTELRIVQFADGERCADDARTGESHAH